MAAFLLQTAAVRRQTVAFLLQTVAWTQTFQFQIEKGKTEQQQKDDVVKERLRLVLCHLNV